MTTGLVLQCKSFHPSENFTVNICVPKVFIPPLPSLFPLLLYGKKRKKPGASYKWLKMADEKAASGEMTEDEKKADEFKLKANEFFKGMVL